MMSSATNYGQETEVDSASGYVGTAHTEHTDMDVDEDAMTSRSVGQFEQEDNVSDDGSASLVGFGEGANSTISGPIYVRRPLPGGMERSASGLSDGAVLTPAAERHDARILDGVSSTGTHGGQYAQDDDGFVDTTNSGPVPVSGNFQPGHNSSLRETQHGAHTRHHWKHQQPPTAREAAERAMRERNIEHISRQATSPLASPSKKVTLEDK
ncbi:hypothetical protein BD289DRAFT_448376 [Coniella lustricola]|uniref:Uncharacterized protein n=1 Tax=Coniella lustricola TaxID=2025994 RepID=A0A2T2ZS95_9PEZI|nr:hypothetical protein BD289DRAFT_448376 [Coniella lustricola]